MASSSKSEQAYIRTSLLANPPLRLDGRSTSDFRPIALETGVVPLANGSARVSFGGAALTGAGGSVQTTEVLAAVKLEVEDLATAAVTKGDGRSDGRVSCSVSCSPAAYPHLLGAALDDLQYDLTSFVQESLGHPSLHPSNLTILPGRRAWLVHLDILVLSNAGNVHDAIFLAAGAALRDTRVPRTRPIEYKAPVVKKDAVDRLAAQDDVPMVDEAQKTGLDTRPVYKQAADYELADYWDEGEPLACSGSWPLCVTLNLVTPISYVDATLMEESATDLRVLLLFSFRGPSVKMHGTRLLGSGETNSSSLKSLLRDGERFARMLHDALEAKLKEDHRKWLHKPKEG